jgi:hypothetical protein
MTFIQVIDSIPEWKGRRFFDLVGKETGILKHKMILKEDGSLLLISPKCQTYIQDTIGTSFTFTRVKFNSCPFWLSSVQKLTIDMISNSKMSVKIISLFYCWEEQIDESYEITNL